MNLSELEFKAEDFIGYGPILAIAMAKYLKDEKYKICDTKKVLGEE